MSEKDLTRLTELEPAPPAEDAISDAPASEGQEPPAPTLTLDDFPSLEEQTAREAAKSKTPLDLGYLDEVTGQIVLKEQATQGTPDTGTSTSESISNPGIEEVAELEAVEGIGEVLEMPVEALPETPQTTLQEAPQEMPLPTDAQPFELPSPIAEIAPIGPEDAVYAPPASAHHLKPLEPTPTEIEPQRDLSEVKKFSANLSIGAPKVEANPPYTFFAKTDDGRPFDERATKAILGALSSEDFGVRPEEVEIQLRSGKFFVPRISEFAAITLVQKLRDVVDTIDVKPTAGTDSEDAGMFFTKESHEHQGKQESWSIGPQKIEEVFATTQNEPSGFKVERILGVVSAAEVVGTTVATNRESPEFEKATERLTKALVDKAFQLGANGVIAISFNLYPVGASSVLGIPGDQTPLFRLLGTGTAVSGKSN